nr:MAG TPA: hypothetical protein [Caudoviricetes sp.]
MILTRKRGGAGQISRGFTLRPRTPSFFHTPAKLKVL